MKVAALLTLLAFAGVAAGVLLGKARTVSSHLSAAGGGLLSGIALFWLLPESAEISGWGSALALTVAFGVGLGLLNHYLLDQNRGHGASILRPLLAATAVHSFLDGWSVRATSGDSLAGIAIPVGLALHKIPEGLALGWIVRRAVKSTRTALALGALAEAVTLVGALLEPRADQSGVERFGGWWMTAVLAVIAGSFLFLAVHAVVPERRKMRVMAVFLITLALVGGASVLKR